MWQKISILILRYRHLFLIGLVAATAFMGWKATEVKMDYDFARVIPSNNPKFLDYLKFRDTFGEDGNVMVLGVQSDRIFTREFFNDWYALGNSVTEIEGVNTVLSIPHSFVVKKDVEERRFKIEPLISGAVQTEVEMDSIEALFRSLPFYEGLLHNPETHATIMAITFDEELLDSRKRLGMTDAVLQRTQEFEEKYNVEVHYSGLPFIRSYKMTTISDELQRFLIYAMIILTLLLFLLFRTVYGVVFPLLVVIIGAIWSVGTLALFGYKITLLTGLLPTLIVVIGIPNCVYMLNKYYSEFKKHGNKQKALTRVIEKIGHVTFFTNLTTAIGFGVFYFTNTRLLAEFGIVAFLNIIATFVISIIAIPVLFSYLPEPKMKHTFHLDNRIVNWMLNTFENWIKYRRKAIYIVSGIALVASIIGIFQLNARGYMLDDVSEESKIYTDLKFFEKNFQGIMPFEIMIETGKEKGATDMAFMGRLKEAADTLNEYSIFSKPIALNNAMQFAMQAYNNGNPKAYRLPSQFEMSQNPILRSYFKRSEMDSTMNLGISNNFISEDGRTTRMSLQIADIGSDSMPKVLAELKPKFDSIFPPETYNVTFTGISIIALEGFRFLIDGLIWSVGLAFLLISLIMGYLFRSLRMLLLALLPNLIPLLVTAGIMGYFSIPLKPSTVLIFSVAFGISVDYTIHFLAKYRQELFWHNWDISRTVMVSHRETGVSMIYTSLILFFGFIIFTASDFDGTVNLGRLTSITLVVAMLSNLVLLPALLVSFERIQNRKAIKNEPLLEVYNEDEDIELDKLRFKDEEQ